MDDMENKAKSNPIRIGFENISSESVYLLQKFEPAPVFFTVHLVKEDGTPLTEKGGGKINIRQFASIELSPRDQYFTSFDLLAVIGEKEPVEKGSYRLSVTYHNQYGADCFKGSITSNVLAIEL